jgi:hypothetical protein
MGEGRKASSIFESMITLAESLTRLEQAMTSIRVCHQKLIQGLNFQNKFHISELAIMKKQKKCCARVTYLCWHWLKTPEKFLIDKMQILSSPLFTLKSLHNISSEL